MTFGDLVIRSVRPVGAMERLFYRYSERNPAHFLQVAEFGETVPADRLRAALSAVQRRHPLLSVHVEDRPDTRLGFYRAATVAPIELTIRRGQEWAAAAAEELSRPFDRSRAPLMRASLLQGPGSSALLLAFDHTIADGISSVRVMNDVIAALNGRELANLPVPQAQERIIDRTLGDVAAFDPSELPDDPRMRTPTSIRLFDGALTNVHPMTMTEADTARLVERCRAERTTVHAAMVVAMCRVRATERGEDFVRVLNPINFRALVGVEGDCGLFIQATWTGLAPWDGAPFWEQARATTAHLETARSRRGILTASLAIQQAMAVDAEVGHAEELFSRVCPFDMLISNLGVQDLDDTGPVRPTAVWGPVVQSQTEGEYVTGITTYEGRLRMVTCGYSVPTTFLKSVGEALAAAVDEA
ncbi:peptide synthetase [Mycobacterium paraense]|uniref:Peptide synthetase n=1 Tax=Mycobacterium paraense TaxID=767916 RepID=A0ABX3VQI3_9MYCO|nr:condensation domain-containing protein [Mycobacterium paraense]ORW32501.1 peptide synthetase [Mycobacterium paraense]ORW37849.1 peptide synthetase [Mycobacterium paraense]